MLPVITFRAKENIVLPMKKFLANEKKNLANNEVPIWFIDVGIGIGIGWCEAQPFPTCTRAEDALSVKV